ncbi:glycoside hydrolase family 99-like domain-containing protein [Phenylobacterium sp. VNQ135]|uniref:glycoside hydrolase family 99-like domain-containing protein n=1 Tax=Phenylobacterium sp. VNQ135 TaxID=3400922 RepID=UPI003C07B7C8
MRRISVGLRIESPRFLTATLRSLTAQTFSDFDLLVVDDSPDGRAADAARRLADPRLKVIDGDRRGPAAALLRIWEETDGPLLKIVDEGDLLRPNALQTLHALLEQEPDAALAFCRRMIVDEDDFVLRRAPAGGPPQRFVPGELPRYVAARLVDPVDGWTPMLLRRSAVSDPRALTTYAGVSIRTRSSLPILMNAAGAPAVGSAEVLAMVRERDPDLEGQRIFEWEALLRGAVVSGLLAPAAALPALQVLEELYARHGEGRGELALLRRGLASLRVHLAAGRTDVLDEAFRSDLLLAESWSAERGEFGGHRLRRRPDPGSPGPSPLDEHARFTAPSPDFEEVDADILQDIAAAPTSADPLLIAFYLPQFHAIPENDRFWGKGFTEWRQLARGAPRFPGHYQPRIPRDLGFYDLSDPDILRRQAGMARAAGVGAFAFYYYAFAGERVLERPLENLLASDIEMPFLLIWANENWSRTWTGSTSDVLLRQDYEPEHEDALLADLARHMADPRYVRLEGRPLFVIYKAGDVPRPRETFARWRAKWAAMGVEPLIFMAQTFGRHDPRPFGLDGALEFPPHKLGSIAPRRTVDAFSADFAGIAYDYDAFIGASLQEPAPPFPLIKTAVPMWDNDARRPGRGSCLTGMSPAKYETWLGALFDRATANRVGGRAIVAVNAWNEWAEGAYLEPDVHFGGAFLNATARAVKRARAVQTRRRAPSSEPLRICVAADSFEVGGGELMPLQIANALHRRGHHVTYLTVAAEEPSERPHLRARLEREIPVVRWDEVDGRLNAFLRERGIQVFNSHNVSIDHRLFYRGIRPPTAYLVSLHGSYENAPEYLTPAMLSYLRGVDLWLDLGDAGRSALVARGLDPRRFRRSFNAVERPQAVRERADIRRDLGLPLDTFALVLGSRAIPQKGWAVAIEACRRLHEQGRRVRLALAGDGPAADALRGVWSGAPFVSFLGHVPDLQAILPAFDLGLFPSTYAGETFPLFLLECLQAGVPVVTTDLGEIPAIMGAEPDARPGALVSGALSPEAMAGVMAGEIARPFTDRRLAARWAANARTTATRYDLESLADLYEACLRELSEQRAVTRPAAE